MGSKFILECDKASELELDPFSELTMTYTADGFNELKKDIKDKGLLVPIILRDGKILDGRHRRKACVELGLGLVCRDVGCISDDEAVDIIISNALNKTTSTDAAKVEAYVMCKAKGLKNVDMPKSFSRLNGSCIKKIAYIEKCNSAYLRALLNQNKVTLYNKEYNKVEDYGTIHGLWRTLKENSKREKEIIEVQTAGAQDMDFTLDVGEYFGNYQAEKEYWEVYNLGKMNGVNLHPATALGSKIATLIKTKYL